MVPGVLSSDVQVVWTPQWGPHMMSEEAQLELNMMQDFDNQWRWDD
jgi:metal-sulfur cluster biosynthetic enzyme